MSDDFLRDLRDQVAAAARRVEEDPRRARSDARSRWPLTVAALLLAIATVGAVVVLLTGPRPSEVQVTREGSDWVFRWDEPGPDVDGLRRAAAQVGADLDVERTPTGSWDVGRVLGGSVTDGPADLRLGDADDDPLRGDLGFRMPADGSRRVTVQLGREARPGERWASGTPATAPGEALGCRSLLGAPLSETLAALDGTGVRLQAVSDLGSPEPPLQDPTPLDLERYSRFRVVALNMVERDQVWADVIEDLADARPILYPQGC